jgi:peptidoglycan/LPS O-acetylase OafA/YrhL
MPVWTPLWWTNQQRLSSFFLFRGTVWPHGACVGLVFALVISVLQPWDERLNAAVTSRPLRFLGMICYSLYLTHEVVVCTVSRWHVTHGLPGDAQGLFVNVTLSVAVALVVGRVFYLTVERRCLNTK